jgi:hypothetical protein
LLLGQLSAYIGGPLSDASSMNDAKRIEAG